MKRLLLAAVLFIHTEISFAKEKLNYTVTSDSQIQNVKGSFEAIGNVVIKSSKNNFEASSNKLTYDKDARTLKLVGNVFVKNLESDEGLSIQESYGDEHFVVNIGNKPAVLYVVAASAVGLPTTINK